MSLIICCDGGEVTASYLVKNNIVPDRFIFTIDNLREELAYIQPDTDTLLFIVSGLTEWTMATVMSMVDSVKKYEQSNDVKLNYTILSNMPLTISDSYNMFDGDLVTGKEQFIEHTPTGFKTGVPVKNKTIDKFIGYHAKRCKYEPLKRGYVAMKHNEVDPQVLRKNIFN